MRKNYTEYRSAEAKYENWSPKEYLDMIIPYLSDMMNDHQTPIELPNNKTTSGEWKIDELMNFLNLL